jgi:uncharacterized protein with ParB-like and HNH nuclease domain
MLLQSEIIMIDENISTYNQIMDHEVKSYEISLNNTTPKSFNLSSKIQKESINLGFKSFMEEVGNLEYKIPKYQRSYVWKKEQIEALVFSLLMDYPIPPIYVYVEPKTNERYILDGQQRVISLYLYFSGHTLTTTDLIDFNKILPTTKQYLDDVGKLDYDEFEKLNGKHLINYIKQSEYNNKLKDAKFTIKVEHSEPEIFDLTYRNLPREIAIELNKKTLNIVTVKTLDDSSSNNNRMEYCEIFNLLNNGGTPLKPQEIRNAIYSSNFYDMLHDVNENLDWKRIVGKEHKHGKHVEFLLRFCSTYHFTEICTDDKIAFKTDTDGNSYYQGAYPSFLNLASEEFQKFNDADINNMRQRLLLFIDKFTFDNERKFPPLMLEGLFLVSQYKEIKLIDNFVQESLLSNDSYKKNVKSSSSSRTKVEERLNIIYGQC